MKLKKLVIILLSALTAVLLIGALCACGGNESLEDVQKKHEGQVKVEYDLQGGIHRNSGENFFNYYEYELGTRNRIFDPVEIFGGEITRANYIFGGWYRSPSLDGGEPAGEPWDFEKDTVGDEGVKLYAYWIPLKNYSYNVCYYDEDGELQILGSYEKLPIGCDFLDYMDYAKDRDGYTFLGQYYQDEKDENGNFIPWDFDFAHPGGDEDTAINVICQYIKGEYALVRTARELIAHADENIYLMNDIDFEGGNFLGFGDYTKDFAGNGHKIYNFNLIYGTGPLNNNVIRDDLKKEEFLDEEGSLLCISLFDNAKGAVVKDVTFADFTINVDTNFELIKAVYVAPFATSIQNSTISGVTIENVTVTCERLPSGLPQDKFHVTTEVCFKADDEKSVDVTLNNIQDKTEEYFKN